MKRQSDYSESVTVERKKLQTILEKENISISCIEHLSNELFYEIFEYLACWEIYISFLNLNSRFQRLIIKNPLLSLKVHLRPRTKADLKDSCQNFIIPNRHRILSLYLENKSFIDDFFTYCITDSSFTRLQSIILRNINIDKFVIPLFHLKSLPHLFSLTMYIDADEKDSLDNIYRMILSFPSLKYNKVSVSSCSEDEHTNILVPLAFNETFSTIEYLIIDHPCTLNEIFSILYHTPGLCHLTCKNVKESREKFPNGKPIMLYKLTHIHINMYEAWFDDFEIFISKLFAPVQVLRIKFHTGSDYLEADDWEQLIKRRIPYLRTFDYQYDEGDLTNYTDDHFHTKINRFTSPFWIRHQWFFEFAIHMDEEILHCAIHPYRNIWLDIYKHSEIATYFNRNISYDCHQEDTNLCPIIQLCINSSSFDEQYELFMNKFKSTFLGVQFTRLKINCKDIPIGIFVEVMDLLSNLDSLEVLSLPYIQSDWLFDNYIDMHKFATPIDNKITNVNLNKIINIEQVHFFLYLCPCIQYFQVNIPKHMDFKMLARFILIQANSYNLYLRFLSLCIRNANEDMVQNLRELIDSEKLLSNYMVKRIGNYIVLKWNSYYP